MTYRTVGFIVWGVGRVENALADELSATFGISAEVAVEDLARPHAAERLAAQLSGRELRIDVLVNNAGVGLHAPLHEADSAVLTNMIGVNVTAVVELTRRYLPGMLERDHGAIINVASTAAFQPLPYRPSTGRRKPSSCRSPRRCGPRPAARGCG